MTWLRRTVTSRTRGEECRQLYQRLGFDVLLRPVADSCDERWDRDERCAGCRQSACADGVIVFTKRKENHE